MTKSGTHTADPEVGIRCPKCNCPLVPVQHTRKTFGRRVRRFRRCHHCKHTFSTYERVA